jgi:hypothetical protein
MNHERTHIYKTKEYINFNWEYYIKNNIDLNNIKTKQEAWEHWINHGKKEGRQILENNFIDYDAFNWEYYIKNNDDLNNIKTKKEAWEHWTNHGKYENRIYKKKVKKEKTFFDL